MKCFIYENDSARTGCIRKRYGVRLTPEAIADPCGTLTAFADFMPVLAKVR